MVLFPSTGSFSQFRCFCLHPAINYRIRQSAVGSTSNTLRYKIFHWWGFSLGFSQFVDHRRRYFWQKTCKCLGLRLPAARQQCSCSYVSVNLFTLPLSVTVHTVSVSLCSHSLPVSVHSLCSRFLSVSIHTVSVSLCSHCFRQSLFTLFLSVSVHTVSVSLCSHCLCPSLFTFLRSIWAVGFPLLWNTHWYFPEVSSRYWFTLDKKKYEICMLFITVVFVGIQRVLWPLL